MRSYDERLERNAAKLGLDLDAYSDIRAQRLLALTQIFAVLHVPQARPSISFQASTDAEHMSTYLDICEQTQTPRGRGSQDTPRFILNKVGTQLPYNQAAEVLQKRLHTLQERYPDSTTEINTFRKCINRHTFKLPHMIVMERVKPRALSR
jgi:hypothetical protein